MANRVDYGIVGYMAPDWSIEKWIDKDGKPTEIKKHHYDWKLKVIFCFDLSNTKSPISSTFVVFLLLLSKL